MQLLPEKAFLSVEDSDKRGGDLLCASTPWDYASIHLSVVLYLDYCGSHGYSCTVGLRDNPVAAYACTLHCYCIRGLF